MLGFVPRQSCSNICHDRRQCALCLLWSLAHPRADRARGHEMDQHKQREIRCLWSFDQKTHPRDVFVHCCKAFFGQRVYMAFRSSCALCLETQCAPNDLHKLATWNEVNSVLLTNKPPPFLVVAIPALESACSAHARCVS